MISETGVGANYKVVLVFGQMNEPLRGLVLVSSLLVLPLPNTFVMRKVRLPFIDNIFRFTQAGSDFRGVCLARSYSFCCNPLSFLFSFFIDVYALMPRGQLCFLRTIGKYTGKGHAAGGYLVSPELSLGVEDSLAWKASARPIEWKCVGYADIKLNTEFSPSRNPWPHFTCKCAWTSMAFLCTCLVWKNICISHCMHSLLSKSTTAWSFEACSEL